MAMAAKAAGLAIDAVAADAGNTFSVGSCGAALPGRLCALCGGGCCTRGADHAYLGPVTLRRVMDAQPHLTPEQVVESYLAHVGKSTQAGSCINHTGTGCSLPRALRSDICNDFCCDALKQVQAAPPGQVVLVVRRAQDQWRRDLAGPDNAMRGAVVLRETGMRRMPLHLAGASSNLDHDQRPPAQGRTPHA